MAVCKEDASVTLRAVELSAEATPAVPRRPTCQAAAMAGQRTAGGHPVRTCHCLAQYAMSHTLLSLSGVRRGRFACVRLYSPFSDKLTWQASGSCAPKRNQSPTFFPACWNRRCRFRVAAAAGGQPGRMGKRQTISAGDLPAAICPITQEIMEDPVVCADGHSYERAAITQWLLSRDTSPATNTSLLHRNVVPNYALRNLMCASTPTLPQPPLSPRGARVRWASACCSADHSPSHVQR